MLQEPRSQNHARLGRSPESACAEDASTSWHGFIQKTAYFFGYSFRQYVAYVGSQGLYADSIELYRQTAGLMLLNVLNRMLEQDIGTRLSDDMFLKLYEAMMQNKEQEYRGTFGNYMIFKNCSKLAPRLRAGIQQSKKRKRQKLP